MKDRNRKSAICNLQSAIRNILLLFLAASLLFSWRSLGAGEVYLLKEAGIRVLFEPPLEPAAKQLTNIYPGVKAELERIFGWDLNLTPSILLIKESKEFQQMIKNPLTVAFALPEKDLIVIDYSKMNIHPFTLRNIFKHELCHLLLHQHIRSVPLPRWLDEGVAQWVSDGIGDIILDQKRSRLNKVALRGRFISLDSLARGFPRREEDLILAYEESKSFVDYIIGKFGREGVLKVLEGMKQGESVHAAVLRACSVSFEDLEKGWQSSLRRKMTWFTYLSYNLYEILFSLAALITVYGSIRIMLKKRRRMREELEDCD
ncbi:MAG: hypothetical protein KKG10_04250 [Proteobacteria bacterium]|nr:hypothetical protein [Pseudomonadota bacterium]